jgi:hypothetical protein
MSFYGYATEIDEDFIYCGQKFRITHPDYDTSQSIYGGSDVSECKVYIYLPLSANPGGHVNFDCDKKGWIQLDNDYENFSDDFWDAVVVAADKGYDKAESALRAEG